MKISCCLPALFLTLMSFSSLGFETQDLVLRGSDLQALQQGLLQKTTFQNQRIMTFGLKNTKKIALTIDDGPTNVTPYVLDYLKSRNIKATFFLLGRQVEGRDFSNGAVFSQYVERMIQEGHEIGNHTYSHMYLLKNSLASGYNEIAKTHEILKPFFERSSQKRIYFRPPGGGWPKDMTPLMNENKELAKYVGPLYWSFGGSIYPVDSMNRPSFPLTDAGDAECWVRNLKVSTCASGYLAAAKRLKGGVMLMHDVDMRSFEMMKLVIDQLLRDGYKFITLDEVQELNQYETELLNI